MVHDVAPRRSRLTDPPVANVDRALLVFALERPPLEAKQLTRFLVSMEHTNVPFDVVLNKSDLVDQVTKDDWAARLEQWGYTPRFVSVATGEGISELEADLARRREADDGESDGESHGVSDRTRVTVLAGPSGVGKSSLINRLRAGSALAEALAEAGELDETDDAFDLDSGEASGAEDSRSRSSSTSNAESGDVEKNVYVTDVDISGGGGGARGAVNLRMAAGVELQSVKAVSAKLGRGRHTTRHVTLLPLKSGGLLADTPGFGYPSLEGVTVDELISGSLFPEIALARRLEGRCKFADCTHRDEPGCAVDAAMPWEEFRYDAYCDVFDEVEAAEKATKAAGYKRETRVRYKDGSVTKEKKHSTKKHSDEVNDEEARKKTNARDARAEKDARSNRGDANRRRRVNRRMEPKLETSARRQSRPRSMETAEMEAFETETLRGGGKARALSNRECVFFQSSFCLSVRRSHESPSGDIRRTVSAAWFSFFFSDVSMDLSAARRRGLRASTGGGDASRGAAMAGGKKARAKLKSGGSRTGCARGSQIPRPQETSVRHDRPDLSPPPP